MPTAHELAQRIQMLGGNHDNIATFTAISPIWTPFWDILFPDKGGSSRAAVARTNQDFSFIA
jgi:hypothetical protein